MPARKEAYRQASANGSRCPAGRCPNGKCSVGGSRFGECPGGVSELPPGRASSPRQSPNRPACHRQRPPCCCAHRRSRPTASDLSQALPDGRSRAMGRAGRKRAPGPDLAALLDAQGVPRRDGQLGHVDDYEEFLAELDEVWQHCFRALVPGGRLICVVGDVCLSRRKNDGRHTVVPLHCLHSGALPRASASTTWLPSSGTRSPTPATRSENGSGFLGKPYEPNARHQERHRVHPHAAQAGRLPHADAAARVLSVISEREPSAVVPADLDGCDRGIHAQPPGALPVGAGRAAGPHVQLRRRHGRWIRSWARARRTWRPATWGRNSIGLEIDAHYFALAKTRMETASADLFGATSIRTVDRSQEAS